MGQLDNTIVVFTTDNGAEAITYPDGGVTPYRGGKLTTWEGGMRAPLVVRWPGHIQPGTVNDQIFSALDWLPTLVDIAGGPKGDELKKEIEAGQYPGIVKTTLDGVNQRAYLEGKGDSARDTFFYYTGAHPSAVRYKIDLDHERHGVRDPLWPRTLAGRAPPACARNGVRGAPHRRPRRPHPDLRCPRRSSGRKSRRVEA